MRVCIDCGNEQEDGDFCKNCGASTFERTQVEHDDSQPSELKGSSSEYQIEKPAKSNSGLMKKIAIGCVVLFLLAIVGAIFGDSSDEQVEKPASSNSDSEAQIFQEVYNLGVENVYYIDNVEHSDMGIYRVDVYILFEPDSYHTVKYYADELCYATYDILKAHGIKDDISVWIWKDESGDRVSVYGRTYYSKTTGAYEFENADQLF